MSDLKELKQDIQDVKENVAQIQANDLPHLQSQITNIKVTVGKIKGELYVLIPLSMAILGVVIYIMR